MDLTKKIYLLTLVYREIILYYYVWINCKVNFSPKYNISKHNVSFHKFFRNFVCLYRIDLAKNIFLTVRKKLFYFIKFYFRFEKNNPLRQFSLQLYLLNLGKNICFFFIRFVFFIKDKLIRLKKKKLIHII